jgi:hypothetical protein
MIFLAVGGFGFAVPYGGGVTGITASYAGVMDAL